MFTKGPHRPLHCTTHTTLPTIEDRRRCSPPTCLFSGQDEIYFFFFLYKLLHDLAKSFTKTLAQNMKTEPERERRGRGVSQRRAIKTARSGVLCVVALCVFVCVCVCAVLKEKVSLHQRGPPATRVRALLGWRPGTDLRVCLKCRLQILCTKSLQEYPWPLESLSGFLTGPAGATHPSLKSSGLAGDEDQGQTHQGRMRHPHVLNVRSKSLRPDVQEQS